MRNREYWEDWLRRNASSLRPRADTLRDWFRLAGVSKGERRFFRAALKGLEKPAGSGRKGKPKKRHPREETIGEEISRSAPSRRAEVGTSGGVREGLLRFTREGRPLVIPDSPGEPAIRIPGDALGAAWPKDRVRVRLERRRGVAHPYGRILQVVERGLRAFVGRYAPIGDRRMVRFRDREADIMIPVTVPPSVRPAPGDLVLAEISEYPARGEEGRARIVRALGKDHTMNTIVLAVTSARDLPVEFSEGALREAGAIPQTVRFPLGAEGRREAPEALARIDQRDLPYVTIDGEDARDFDDAVCLVQEHGRIRLFVAIADVSHYVPEGSQIDRDAYIRGTSVYFPDRALPMLPAPLSEGLCSLKPGVNRLAVTVEIPIDPRVPGDRPSFYPSVIRSRARLTYDQVHAFLSGLKKPGGRSAISPEIGEMLRRMETTAGRLTLARADRGALDFDLPEARIVVDGGLPVTVEAAPRWEAHRLIEEFMLLANTAVAEFLAERNVPFLFRVHEEPAADRVVEFEDTASRLLRRTRVTETRDVSSRLQAWTAAARGGKYERYLAMALLRSLMLARYGPSPGGHFGLALSRYTHFTSPIRRYPDLIVHRVLKASLGERLYAPYVRRLSETGEEMGSHLSARERAAVEAERDVEQRAKALCLSTKVGTIFDGVISSIVGYGFYVELLGGGVEGLVHISSLRDDQYRYSSERGEWHGLLRKKRFGPGDRIRVKIWRTDVDRGEIDLLFVEKLPDSL